MSAKFGFHCPVRWNNRTSVLQAAFAFLAVSFLVPASVAQSQQGGSRLARVRQTLVGEWRTNLSDAESWSLEFRNRDIVWRGGNEVVAEGATWDLHEIAGSNNAFEVVLNGESPDEHAMIIVFESLDRILCPLFDGTHAAFDRVGGRAMRNHGFEQPEIGQENLQFVQTLPGWQTTDTEFEIWGSGFMGVRAHEGNQFVELNAHQDGTLSQKITGIARGATIEFSFAHRGRNGEDTMQLTLTDLGPDNAFGSGDDRPLFAKQYTTGNDEWAVYDSTTEPKIQALGNSVRFAYTAVQGTGGDGPDKSEGNFLDAADFGVGVVAKRNTFRRYPLAALPPKNPPHLFCEQTDEYSSPSSPSTSSPIVLGKYQADQPSNDWHYVTIEQGTGGNLLWKNKAGVSWTIEIRKGSEIWFGKDCPYGEMKLRLCQTAQGISQDLMPEAAFTDSRREPLQRPTLLPPNCPRTSSSRPMEFTDVETQTNPSSLLV